MSKILIKGVNFSQARANINAELNLLFEIKFKGFLIVFKIFDEGLKGLLAFIHDED